MLNVIMEESDMQVCSYTLHRSLDVLIINSGNTKKCTNRDRIETSLKNCFGAQVYANYSLEGEITVITQEELLTMNSSDHSCYRVTMWHEIEAVARGINLETTVDVLDGEVEFQYGYEHRK